MKNAEEIAKKAVEARRYSTPFMGPKFRQVSVALIVATETLKEIILDEEEYELCDQHAAVLLAREALAKIRSEGG